MEQALPIIALFAVPSAVLILFCLMEIYRAKRRRSGEKLIHPLEQRPLIEAVQSRVAYSRMAPTYFTPSAWLLNAIALVVGVAACSATVLITGAAGKIGAEQGFIAFLTGTGLVLFVGHIYLGVKERPVVYVNLPPEPKQKVSTSGESPPNQAG